MTEDVLFIFDVLRYVGRASRVGGASLLMTISWYEFRDRPQDAAATFYRLLKAIGYLMLLIGFLLPD